MARTATSLVHGIFTVGLLCTFSTPAIAGLIGRSPSYVEPLADGRHILVFLVSKPTVEDGDEIDTLPNGQAVALRKTFPATGCYEIGSTAPLWTAPWEDYEIWIVSDDCRYLVRCNRKGPGSYQKLRGGEFSWGLKFYDRGKETKSYDFVQLVDYPSLMPDSWASDFRYDWIGGDQHDLAIRDGVFNFQTTTHERYSFDMATGEIVEQHRMWRTTARVAAVSFALLGILATGLVIPRMRRAVVTDSNEHNLQPELPPSQVRRSAKFGSFSLRTLLLLTTAVALLCCLVPRWPHIALLVSAVLIAVLLTRAAIRYRATSQQIGSRGRRRAKFRILAVAAGLAWFGFYILTAAPVLSFVEWLDAPADVQMAVIMTVYRPLVWIHIYPSLYMFFPLKWYFRAW
jgi:hypothetical protein